MPKKEPREQVPFRLPKSKKKALNVKVIQKETTVQAVMEKKVDEYLKERAK